MLAEKLETPQEFRQARDMGFALFQGFFFRRPDVVTAREVPANKAHYLRLLDLVSREEVDMRELERLIKREAAICYRLLRYLNSPLLGFSLEIKSVRHAMAILGERELRRWIRLVVTAGAAGGKSNELLLSALSRAGFCELLPAPANSGGDLFLLGLLSVMDALLEVPIETVLDQVPVGKETKATVLGQPSPLRPLYQLMLTQESGEWDSAAGLATDLKISEEDIASTWWQSMQWAQQVRAGV